MTLDLSLADYHLTETLYEGVKTVVYRGEDEKKKRPVVIKILKNPHPEPKAIAELKHEYQLVNHLKLPNIVKLYSLHFYENRPYLVLEDFGGDSLKNYLDKKPLDIGRFLNIALYLAKALGDLHTHKLIHKDIKPQNIIINPQTEEVKLTDFGIASHFSRENSNNNISQLEGTLAYISPEQTGRMNRAVDYRTDFYSLGVTFYEMLAGHLPFNSEDAMTMVHSHIAQTPIPLRQVNPNVPQAITNIVMKLMAKTAEARYQSAQGLVYDLEKCRQQWLENSTIHPFPLGEKDIADQFQIPQKLYGRDNAVQHLLEAFALVSQGETELVMVTGDAGIGKSSVVREVYKPITEQRGYMATGKFMELQRNIPYSGLLQALAELMRQLLTESESEIQKWRENILHVLKSNGQIIIDLIPELALIIGQQQAVPNLPPAEAQNRFLLVFQQFLQVFSQPKHPLVLFLDDMQWADVASLQLLQTVLVSPTSQHILFIGAYRHNEVKEGDLLHLSLREIENAGKSIQTIHLTPLTINDINHLIVDTLHCNLEQAKLLGLLVEEKTRGNPFFITELLKSLYTEEKLTFDHKKGEWVWDIQEIRDLNLSDNVVDLVIGKLQQLPLETQEMLILAACLGNRFEIKELSYLSEKTAPQTALALRPALLENFIWANNSSYQLAELDVDGLSDDLFISYQFAHDRIHQAIYGRLTDRKKQDIHRRIGQFLQENLPLEEQEKNLFTIVDHLNLGQTSDLSQSQKDQLVALNQRAGKKARETAAYQASLNYYKTALAFYPPTCWQENYESAFQIHIAAAEAAYLGLDFDIMEELLVIALDHAQTNLDKAKVHEIQIMAYVSNNQRKKTLDLTVKALALLDVKLPRHPNRAHVGLALGQIRLALMGKDVDSLSSLPAMTDPKALVAVQIMSHASAAALFSLRELYALLVLWRIRLSLKYGNTPIAASSFNGYGIILCGLLDNLDTGYRFGRVAVEMVEKLRAPEFRARIHSTFYSLIFYWKHPYRESLPHLMESFQYGLESGDFEFASYGLLNYDIFRLFLDTPLIEFQKDLQQHFISFQTINQTFGLYGNLQIQQYHMNLMEDVENPTCLSGRIFQIDKMLPRMQELNDRTNIFFMYYNGLTLSLIFGQYEEAVQQADKARPYLDAVTSVVFVPAFYLHDALARLNHYKQATNEERKKTKKYVKAVIKKYKNWIKHCPENFLPAYYLLLAEYERVLGQSPLVANYYDRAIEQAQQQRHALYIALANELAGQSYLDTGKTKIAEVYLREARYAYFHWGAFAKVRILDEQYPHFKIQSHQVRQFQDTITNTLTLTTVGTMTTTGSGSFDLDSIVKATQVIFSEVDLDRLLQKMMRLMIENAGAQRGALFLLQAGKLVLKTVAIAGQETATLLEAIPLTKSENVPISLIQYVARTKEPMALDNVSEEGMFTGDPFVVENQTKSVLCVPLVNQNVLVGVLYLENNLAAAAFPMVRVRTINILGTQAAISITNTQALQAKSEQERLRLEKEFLELKNQELAKVNADKDRFFSIISHDLRAPFNPVLGFAQMLMLEAEDLPPEEIVDIGTSIYNSSKGVLDLLNTLLAWSRLQTGRMNYRPAVVSLVDVVSTTLELLVGTALDKRIKLENNVHPDIDVFADRNMLETIIRNLVSNALKFTHVRGTITVSACPVHSGIEVAITDTGIGIRSEDIDKLFKIDVHHSTLGTANEKGTGLGLIMCRELVEKNGGRIWVESELHAGTTFKFTLPASDPNKSH